MKCLLLLALLSTLISASERSALSSLTKVQITLHVFSGTPDPAWTILRDDRSFQEIVSRLAGHVSTPLASRLGYSGFSVDKFNGAVISSSETVGMCKEPGLETFLLNTVQHRVPDGADGPLGAQVIDYVRNTITSC